MRLVEWNALRAGDMVLAHDPHSAELTLLPGVVTQVDSRRRGHGPNQIGVDIAAGESPPVILWPARLAVHRDPRDLAESCWRCQAIAFRTRELLARDDNDGAPVKGLPS